MFVDLCFCFFVIVLKKVIVRVYRWFQFIDDRALAFVLSGFNTSIPGFSLTFEVEGHWLVSRQVPCETDGRRPETVGGSGGMLPRKIFRT